MDEIAALIEPLIPALRRYARVLVRDRDGADDLVQDCLEHALARWHFRRPGGNLRAWLFTILHNHFVTSVRQRRRQGTKVSLEEIGDLPLTEGPQEGRLAIRDVLMGLYHLPPEQRAVLVLVGVEEMSYAEAATILGVPIGTVMSRVSRAREGLHRYVETGRAQALRRVK